MFTPTNRQRSVFEAETMLPENARRRLKKTWAATFAEQVLPVLLRLEPEFASLYGTKGRPNWSVARMMGLCVIRELLGVRSDKETVEALSFDLRFQHALGVSQEDAYLSRRSLVDFRRRLAAKDPDGELVTRVFDEVTSAALRDMGVSTKTQRMDSTFIRSNMALRGRTALLSEALERLLKVVETAGALDQVPEELRAQVSPEGWGGKHSFEEIAGGLWTVLKAFESHEAISATTAYTQAKELFGDHVIVADEVESANANTNESESENEDEDENEDENENASESENDGHDPDDGGSGGSAQAKDRKALKQKRRKKNKAQRKQRRKNRRTKGFLPSKTKGVERRQSLHDPDARRGHKGTGYHAHITETVGNEGRPELITSVSVTPANASDSRSTVPLIEGLESKGCGADIYIADAGYGTAELLQEVEQKDVQLVAPMRNPWRNRPADMLTREDFVFDEDGRVIQCPSGQQPLTHSMRKSSSCSQEQRHLHVIFNAETCQACEHRERCPVSNLESRGHTKLCVAGHLRRRDSRLREQKEPAFRELYANRAAIEGTNSELKRAHALGRLTVRGMKKVTIRVQLKALGCNIKRWTQYRAAA